MNKEIRIGCQGWNYDDWVSKALGEKVFYPHGTKTVDMLSVYAKAFSTVEVDSTFYAIPSASAVEGWYNRTPDHFTFALKLPREITHERMLHEETAPILLAFCERVSELKDKLASVLVQLPPNFDATKENAVRLRRFLSALPKGIDFAVEFRSRDWMVDWTYDELMRHGASLCLVEGSWIPREMMFAAIAKMEATSTYVRFMGDRDITEFNRVHREMDPVLSVWDSELRKIQSGSVNVYFSNFFEGLATVSSNKLKTLLGQRVVHPEELENQKSLF